MIAPLTVGAVAGLGLWLIVLAVVPARAPLAATIARLHRHTVAASVTGGIGPWVAGRVGRDRLAGTPARRADLAVLERPVEQYAATLATAAIVGAAAPVAVTAAVRVAGISLGVLIPIWVAVVCSALAVAVVIANLAEQAGTERRALRHQLGAYLDVLAMLLSAAEADEQALQLAAQAGDGRLFQGLNRAYRDAAIAGQPMLTGMARLGQLWALPELVEIAAAGSLAASDGAAVRRTLMAKARAMRTAQLAEEETEARLRTTKLGAPQILIAVGFIVMVLYPAFAGLLTGLDQ